MPRIKKLFVLAVATALALSTMALTASAESERTYEVTVTNLTSGQIMTPYVVATHDGSYRLFGRGMYASDGLQQVAENGDVPVLVAELGANPAVNDVQVAAPAAGPPVFPGQSVSAVVAATSSSRYLTVAGMLICTNDGFGGVTGVKLPNESRTVYAYAWDAGTEINTESYADLVPPCDGSGLSGMTNPTLAENGTVHRHQGIIGGADLDPAVHGWTGAVLKIEIELIN